GDIPLVRRVQDGFLAPETGEEERDARERHHADRERGERDLQVAAQATELADVLLVVRGVDDRTSAEEEQRLEEGVGQQVEDGRDPRANPERQHHIAELGNGGKREDALDVALAYGD